MGVRVKIAVLYGGWSSERPISLLSGRAVARALEEAGHRVVRIDPRDRTLADVPEDVDAVFILLHGAFGEDGGAQEVLQRRGIPYTGSGPDASRLAMDKVAAREAFSRAEIAVAPGMAVRRGDPSLDAERVRAAIGPPPWFVKPSCDGSSMGVTRVVEEARLPAALETAFGLGETALIEKAVAGREFTVGILGDRTLPLIELKPEREFYDYKAKYAPDGGTQYVVFPTLPLDDADRIAAAARGAFAALGCRDVGRVDVILGRDRVPYVLEVNTIPGMTEKSLLPKAAAATGLSFGQLCERIVELALTPRT